MQVSEAVASLQPPVASGNALLADRFGSALAQLLVTDDWPRETPLAIALSGGADSMVLVLLADEYARARGGRIVALTVDHGLRAESRSEAEQVATWMRARNIAHHILTPEHHDVSNNLQEAARMWRYDALAEFCAGHGILHCLVAHNAGDNRESFLHNEMRGDTRDGRAGMARVRLYRGVRFLRPMLGFERSELEDFLRSKNAAWVEDPSNQNPKFARVRNRKLLQENAAQNAALDEAIGKNAAARAMRDNALAQAAIRCVAIHPLGFAEVDLLQWRALEPNLASQLLADCITTISGATHRPRAHETARLAQALQHPNFRKRTLQHCEISLRDDVLRIAREPARVEGPRALSGSGTCVWDTRFRVRYALPANKTYTLRALGNDGSKQLTQMLKLKRDAESCSDGYIAQRTSPPGGGSRRGAECEHKISPHPYPPPPGEGFPRFALSLREALPISTPTLWHLDTLVHVPYIYETLSAAELLLGFAPPKPLAPPPFW